MTKTQPLPHKITKLKLPFEPQNYLNLSTYQIERQIERIFNFFVLEVRILFWDLPDKEFRSKRPDK